MLQALPVRQFLLTNAEIKDGKIGFRNPLAILDDAIGRIGEFPFKAGEISWDGPTLFVKGTKSAYINRHNAPRTKDFFPNSVRAWSSLLGRLQRPLTGLSLAVDHGA